MKTATFLLFIVTACRADVISLNSGVSPDEWNNITGTNVLIQPHPLWAVSPDAKWISYTDTGMGGAFVPNDLGETLTASFYQDFYMTGENNRAVGDITVWADDSASVFLDGVPLYLRSLFEGSACAGSGIGCTQEHGVDLHFDILGDPGSKHTLRFDAYQQWGNVFGLMYTGSVELSDPLPPVTPNPEPGSLGILGGLLLAGATFARVRYEARKAAPPARSSE